MAELEDFRSRSALLWGEAGAAKLAGATVAVFGLGGVGAAAALDLARAGVGRILAYDFDAVAESNLNRLAFGYRRYLGQPKAEAFRQSALEVNPAIVVEARPLFITGDTAAAVLPEDAAFCLDCIDALNPKVNLLAALAASGRPFAASMGMGGRLDPGRVRLGPLWTARGCPLAREVRQRLRRRGYGEGNELVCAWSDERVIALGDLKPPAEGTTGRPRRRQGSSPFVPQTAGHLLASWAVRRLLGLV
jgi:tRNA A37 threonylcarbamoyladenosine dehydratase